MKVGDRVECVVWADGPEEEIRTRGALLYPVNEVGDDYCWIVRWDDARLADTREYESRMRLLSAVERLAEVLGNTEA